MARIDSEVLKDALKVYFIFGSNNCLKNPIEVLKEAIAGGISIFQFREKGKDALQGLEKVELAKELQSICKENSIPFIVNDDIELALEINADGVHIGQEDEPVESVRKKIGNRILGVSAHTVKEAQAAVDAGADYLGIGPIFPTKTKEDAKAVQGTILIKELRTNQFTIPLVGIGGITSENANSVIQAGADGVSVITAISLAQNIKDATRLLRKNVQSE
jgi:thiamine-phosphate pyrophosphorylase